MLAIGGLLLLWRSTADAGAAGLLRRRMVQLVVVVYFAGLAGARFLFVIEHRDLLPGPWWGWLWNPVTGGFASYGGVLAGSSAAVLYAWRAGLPVGAVLDAGAVGLCLFGFAARAGCFLVGCCYGKPTDCPWAVVYPAASPAARRFGESAAVHPTQLYEAALLVVAATVVAAWPSYRAGERFLRLAAFYSGIRFTVDFFRGDSLANPGGLTLAQWISLVLLAGSVVVWVTRRRKPCEISV